MYLPRIVVPLAGIAVAVLVLTYIVDVVGEQAGPASENFSDVTFTGPIGADHSSYPDRVYIGEGYLHLKPSTSGWQRDVGWPLAKMKILLDTNDTLVLQTEKDHEFDVDSLGDHKPGIPVRFKADAYRYVCIDSSMVSVPRWRWRRMLDRLDRREKVYIR